MGHDELRRPRGTTTVTVSKEALKNWFIHVVSGTGGHKALRRTNV